MSAIRSLFCSALLALAAGHAGAAIVPASYTIDQATTCGSYCYHDSTGGELTDGVVGREGWAADLGNGHAAEWLGWTQQSRINIDFTFASSIAIGAVHVGSTQDSLLDVALPSLEVYGWSGAAWVLAGSLAVPPSSANDRNSGSTAAHGFLDVSGLNITSDKLRLSLLSNGPWTFIDEVTFDAAARQGNALPEPAGVLLMGTGLGLLALARRRVRR